MQRAYDLDRLRVVLIALVFFHHSSIAFGAHGSWYYVTPHATAGSVQFILMMFMAVNQAFFMSLFFFISALLMPASFDRKGFGQFMKDRLMRLGIPLAVYTLLIHPSLKYAISRHLGTTSDPWLDFVWIADTHYPAPGPMWFALTLLIFETAYALYRHSLPVGPETKAVKKLPSPTHILAFIVGTGLLAFGIRLFYPIGSNFFGLQFGYFMLYITMYSLGIIAGRDNWLERFTIRQAWPWFISSLLAIPAFGMVVLFSKAHGAMGDLMGGINLRALAYAMWEPLICVGFSFFLLMVFKKYLNAPGRLVSVLSADSYPFYVIHPPFVAGFTVLSEQVALPPLARLMLVLVLGIPTCFLAAHLLRKIPGLKRIL
ncbi:MAG TPA: acyltransferase family protein [Syntrophales bacterium]|nr:acyltransferase family protein [Syntrophales bacterium]